MGALHTQDRICAAPGPRTLLRDLTFGQSTLLSRGGGVLYYILLCSIMSYHIILYYIILYDTSAQDGELRARVQDSCLVWEVSGEHYFCNTGFLQKRREMRQIMMIPDKIMKNR